MAEPIIDVKAAAKAAGERKANTPAPKAPEAVAVLTGLSAILGDCEIVKGKESRPDDDGGSTLHVGNVRINLGLCGHVAAKVYMRTREINGAAVTGFSASFPSMRLGGAGAARFVPIFRDVPQDTRDAIAAHWQAWYLGSTAEKKASATVTSSTAAPLVAAVAGIDISALAGLAKKPKLVPPAPPAQS